MYAFFKGNFNLKERFTCHYMAGADNFIVIDKDAELIKQTRGQGVTNFNTLKRISYHYFCKVILATNGYSLVKLTPNLLLEARDRVYAKNHDPYALYERLCQTGSNASNNGQLKATAVTRWSL